MRSLTATTRWAFLCLFTAEIGLHRHMAVLRFLILILPQRLLDSVAVDFDDLLTLALARRGVQIMDVAIPRSVGEAHLVAHAMLELTAFLQAFVKLFEIAGQVLLIEARRADLFLSSALFLFFSFDLYVAKYCSFIVLLLCV